jgi:hypothetical protein
VRASRGALCDGPAALPAPPDAFESRPFQMMQAHRQYQPDKSAEIAKSAESVAGTLDAAAGPPAALGADMACTKTVKSLHIRCAALVANELWLGEWDGSISVSGAGGRCQVVFKSRGTVVCADTRPVLHQGGPSYPVVQSQPLGRRSPCRRLPMDDRAGTHGCPHSGASPHM